MWSVARRGRGGVGASIVVDEEDDDNDGSEPAFSTETGSKRPAFGVRLWLRLRHRPKLRLLTLTDGMSAVRRFLADLIVSSPPENHLRPPDNQSSIHPMGAERRFDTDYVVTFAAVYLQHPIIDSHIDTVQAYPPPPTPPSPLPPPSPNSRFYGRSNVADSANVKSLKVEQRERVVGEGYGRH